MSHRNQHPHNCKLYLEIFERIYLDTRINFLHLQYMTTCLRTSFHMYKITNAFLSIIEFQHIFGSSIFNAEFTSITKDFSEDTEVKDPIIENAIIIITAIIIKPPIVKPTIGFIF